MDIFLGGRTVPSSLGTLFTWKKLIDLMFPMCQHVNPGYIFKDQDIVQGLFNQSEFKDDAKLCLLGHS